MKSEPSTSWQRLRRVKVARRNGFRPRIFWPGIRKALALSAVALLSVSVPELALAQGISAPAGSTWAILEQDLLILFRILVVATVIERLLEYLSLAWPYLLRAWDWLLARFGRRAARKPREQAEETGKIRKQLVLQGVGILIGVAICWRAHLGIFGQLEGTAGGRLGEAVAGWFVDQAGTWLDFVVTGILVGLGTEPIHSIINTILRRRDLRKARLAGAG